MNLNRRELLAALLAAAAPAAAAPAAAPATREFRRQIPFYAGRSDLDAGIACGRMVLSFFEPMEHFPVADVAEMTSYTEGHWFFEPQLVPILAGKGRKPTLYSDLNYAELAAGRGLDRFGPEAEKMVDRKALDWAAAHLNENNRRPAVALPALLEQLRSGGVLMIAADRATLRSEPLLPYCRCHLIVTGFSSGAVRVHDPSRGPNLELPLPLATAAFGHPAAGRSALLVL